MLVSPFKQTGVRGMVVSNGLLLTQWHVCHIKPLPASSYICEQRWLLPGWSPVSQGQHWLTVTNTLAYRTVASIAEAQSFIIPAKD